MYTIRQAADLLGMQPKVLRRCVAEGQLPGATATQGKHGGATWRIPPEAIEAWRQREALKSAQLPEPPQPRLASRLRTEAEILATYSKAAPPTPLAQHAPQALQSAQVEHLVPMGVVVDLLHSEAENRRSAQRIVEEQAATIAILRQAMEAERDEVLRLRFELADLRQTLQEAQSGLLRVARRQVPQVDQDRETQPLDMEMLRKIAMAN